ncbi:MAG: ferritin-like domain-containing protein [Rhodobacteraceae bacterium]|nr:ferritin-like domain-containing protein [Paracoccaceae bacterium]
MKTFKDLFLHFLQDMYFAEQSILKVLPDLVEAADNGKLKQSLADHIGETKDQIARLEKTFAALGEPAEGVTCEAILGLLQETDDILKETGKPGPLQDAAIIACAQAIEHYEIARFMTLTAWANSTQMGEAAPQLQRALNVERAKNAKLNELAWAEVYENAVMV